MSYTLTKRQKTVAFVVLYCLAWAVASYLFYLRFPDNFREPNFYAEDGNVFLRNLLGHNFLQAAFTTFTGYFITGLYVIEQIAVIVNAVLFHGEFVNLARSLSIVSYATLGFITTLPILLFRKYLPLPILLLVVMLGIYVPLTGSDYAVIGAIGNLKFAFTYVAFLLLVYRHLMPADSKKVYLVDAGILLCAYTNITVYVLMPFALLRYLPPRAQLSKLKTKDFYRQLIRERSFQSLLGLGLLLLPQVIIIALHGIPKLPGYLDSGYRSKTTVEIFFDRSFVYSLLYPINKHLSDIIVIIASVIGVVGGIFAAGRYRKFFIFGLFAIFVTSFLFVIKRTGVSEFFGSYASGGPDQFFYTQNLIAYFMFGLALTWLVTGPLALRYKRILIIFVALAAGMLISRASVHVPNDFMATNIGNIYANAQRLCTAQPTTAPTLTLPIYPGNGLVYDKIPRHELCTQSALSYQPSNVSFGLKPDGNRYIDNLGTTNHFSQTFVSPRDGLSGLNVYFSTFAQPTTTPYDLTVYDASCHNVIRSAPIGVSRLRDNAYAVVSFDAITNSQNATYCFTVSAHGPPPSAPLAVQLSAPNIYLPGKTTLNGQPLEQDVVFGLHY